MLDRAHHPATWTGIRGEFANRGGNKRLKSALFNSAFASLHHEPSRQYYDKKRAEHKSHKQSVVALARHRLDTLYAMLRDGTFYHDQPLHFQSTFSLKQLDKNCKA